MLTLPRCLFAHFALATSNMAATLMDTSSSSADWRHAPAPRRRRSLPPNVSAPPCASNVINLNPRKVDSDRAWKIPAPDGGDRLTAKTIADKCNTWSDLLIWTQNTKNPFFIACLMAAMVTHCEGKTTFMQKLQQVGDGQDDNACLLDIVLTVWPELWTKLSNDQQTRVAHLLQTQHINSPRKIPAPTRATPAAAHSQVTQSPKKQKPRTNTRGDRRGKTVYEGLNIITKYGALGYGAKREMKGPLASLTDGVTDLSVFLKATESTHNPLIVAYLLFSNEEGLFGQIKELLMAIVTGSIPVKENEPMHIVVYTAVSCWPELYHDMMAPEQQERFRSLHATTRQIVAVKRKTDAASSPLSKKIDLMHASILTGVTWEIREMLLTLYRRYRAEIRAIYPDFTSIMDRYADSPNTHYVEPACLAGKCDNRDPIHRKRCQCKTGKCPTLGCKDFQKDGKCTHDACCVKIHCPTKRCSHSVSLRESGVLIDLMAILASFNKQLDLVDQFIRHSRYIQPVANSYTGAYHCGLNIGKATLVCFAIFSARIEYGLNSDNFSPKAMFENQNAHWWNHAWSMLQGRLPTPFFTVMDMKMLSHHMV